MKCAETRGNGWAFEFDNDAYPDIDDTTIVVLALLEGGDRAAVRDRRSNARGVGRSRCDRATALGRHSIAIIRARSLYRMPFSDFGAMIDPPTEDVTAHVLEMLAALRLRHVAIRTWRAVSKYLRETQKPGGSWFGRWGVNHIYGTWCVISALVALQTGDDMIERAAQWLLSVQNPDGGWGETLPFVRRRIVCRRRPKHAVADGLGRLRSATCRARATSGGLSVVYATCASASGPTGPGTSRSTPERASRATSTSTITSTAIFSRRWPSP